MSIFDKYDLVEVDESFPIPNLPAEGLILLCGSSGSGKSTILKKTLGSLPELNINADSLIKNFSSEQRAEDLLIACGLRTIPAWKRKYQELSNGEQHRAFCALCLDRGIEYIDEFTSVVDRETAKALSYSIQKYFRSGSIKRLILASCHRDIIDWLNPDYLYDTDLKRWEFDRINRGLLRRPKITIQIEAVDGQSFWSIFKKHHYLTGKFNKSANAFVAKIENKPVGFCSILRYPSGTVKNAWREHRTVVLPEFQGLGIGTALSNTIAKEVVSKGGRFFSKTSHPAFGLHREKSKQWKPTSKNMKARNDYKEERASKEDGHKMKHKHRVCYSHEFIN